MVTFRGADAREVRKPGLARKISCLRWASAIAWIAGLAVGFLTERIIAIDLFGLVATSMLLLDWHLNRRIGATLTVLSLNPPSQVTQSKPRYSALHLVSLALLAASMIFVLPGIRVFAVLAFISVCLSMLNGLFRSGASRGR
jgi:hypothetical protein